MPAAIEGVRQAFLDLAAGYFVVPARQVFGDGAVLVMSTYHTPTGTAVVKKISIDLTREPAIRATLIWTGGEQIVADGTVITTIRTGAVVGLATDLLAPADATRLTLIGTGGQAADQVRAVLAVRPIAETMIAGRNPDRARTLAASLTDEFPQVKFTISTDINDAVAAADIICCATSTSTPLFEADALPDRVHVNAIGAFRPTMRELPRSLLTTASLVLVDQREAALEESGEIIDAVQSGALSPDSLVELGTALATHPHPTTGRTVFKSVGLGLQDWAIANLLSRS